jgi:hypothetical protein
MADEDEILSAAKDDTVNSPGVTGNEDEILRCTQDDRGEQSRPYAMAACCTLASVFHSHLTFSPLPPLHPGER